MPTRVIDSDIWRDEWFGTLGFMEQALWIGLFSSCADCQGRLLDNAALIRATIWPYQDVSMESINVALAAFAAERKILRYIAGGKACIQVLRWWRYQYPRWASASKLPPPDRWQDHVRTSNEGGILENNWGSRESRIAGESEYLTEVRKGNPSREPVRDPSVLNSDSVNDPDSDRRGTPYEPPPPLDPVIEALDHAGIIVSSALQGEQWREVAELGGVPLFVDALQEATTARNGLPTVNYTRAIVQRCVNTGSKPGARASPKGSMSGVDLAIGKYLREAANGNNGDGWDSVSPAEPSISRSRDKIPPG